MNAAGGFSEVFDNKGTAEKSVTRMQDKASGNGYSLGQIFKAPFAAAAALLDGLFAIPEKILGYMGDTALGLQRALTEVPTGALFEGARLMNSHVAPKVYGSPSAIIRWLRGGVKRASEKMSD